jgi:hypothetical protein
MRRAAIVLAACAIAACDQPPVKEIAAAEQQVGRAKTAQADHYAPERFGHAEAALATARAKLRERDYRSALSAANDAAESARVAMEATGPAKAAARKEAELAVVEVRTMIERATTERNAALEAGVPRASLAAAETRLTRVAQQVTQIGERLGRGDDEIPYLAGLLASLRTEVTPLPDVIRQARTTWEAKHPKGRAKRR